MKGGGGGALEEVPSFSWRLAAAEHTARFEPLHSHSSLLASRWHARINLYCSAPGARLWVVPSDRIRFS
eukprot:3557784-Prymnesium_polylepis.1